MPNYRDIAEALPSGVFGPERTLVYPSYSEKGAYLWSYNGYQFLGPDRVITVSGETHPVDQIEFNEWMKSLHSIHPLKKSAA